MMAISESIVQQVSIVGLVKDALTQKPISGAFIELTAIPGDLQNKIDLLISLYGENWEDRPDQTHTDAEGMFHFTDLPDGGEYTIQASLPIAGTRYASLVVASGTVTVDGAINLGTDDIIELDLSPTAITGSITDGSSGEPISMAKIQVQGSGETMFSNQDGYYQLVGIEVPGQGFQPQIQVTASGYTSQSQPVEALTQGESTTLDFALSVAA